MLNKLAAVLIMIAPVAYAQEVTVEAHRCESTVAQEPAKIVVFDMAAMATLDNALVGETAAWQNDSVIYLDASAIYIAGGGIQSMGLTFETITAAMTDG